MGLLLLDQRDTLPTKGMALLLKWLKNRNGSRNPIQKKQKKEKKKEEKEKEKKRQMGLPIWDQKGWYQVATLPNREVFFKTASWVLDKTSNTVTKTDRQKERTEWEVHS